MQTISELWRALQPLIQQEIAAIGSRGGGSGSGGLTQHALDGAYHSGILGDSQAPQFAKLDGSRLFTGNIAFVGAQTVDGVDVSAHAGNANAHHNQSHVLATTSALGGDHSVSGLTTGQVLRATGATTAAFGQLQHSQLGGIGANDHHNQQHSITGSDHTVTGAALDIIGLSATNTLGVLTPSSAPTNAKILASDSSGNLTLQALTTVNAITVSSDTDSTSIVGRTKIFSATPDNTMLAHFDHATLSDYGWRQTSAGQTLINAASGQSINHRINNSDIMTMTAGGLTISGGSLSITGSGDFTVGSNILFVDNSGSNVGVNCAPDPQFDLDVGGNFRAQGFIVGKHAIQIDNAAAIFHWDGVSTNTTGETRSHLGQAPTSINNSPEFVPGKFGKAVSVGSSQSCYINNPSFETNTTGWTASSSTITRTSIYQAHGGYCLLMSPTSTNGFTYVISNTAATIGNSYCFAVWLRVGTGTTTVRLYIQRNDGGVNYATNDVTVTDAWQLFFVTGTASVADAPRCVVQSLGTTPIYIDAAQLFDGTIPRPFSTASRAGSAYLDYNTQGIDPNQGTIMMWAKPYSVNTLGYAFYAFNAANTDRIHLAMNSDGKWRVIIGTSGDISSTSAATARTWYHVAMTWNAGSVKIYVNGVLNTTGIYTSFTTIPPTYQIGAATSPFRGDIDDVVIRSVETSEDEIRAIYESNAPVFAETSTFNFRAGSGLVWADAEGLWMYDASGNAILGVSAVDSKSWGGRTINTGDFSLGQYGASNGGWFMFDQIDTSSKPSLTMGYGTTEALRFDSSGNKITGALAVTGSLTAGGAIIDANGISIGADSSFSWSTASGFQNVTVTTGKAYRFTGVTQNNFLGMTGNYASNTSTLALVNENETASGASKSSKIILDARTITDDAISGIGTSSVILAASQWAPNQGGVVNVAKISMTVASVSSIDITLDSLSAEIKGALPYAVLAKQASTPNVYGSETDQAKIYFKGTKLIVMYEDAGTDRYKYLDLAGTGVTWVHTTTAP